MKMQTSFAALSTNPLSRKFGGTKVGTAEPYLTGYHFIHFDKLPANLSKYTAQGVSGLNSEADISSVLHASCLSVTPPGGTLNKVEFTGLGGIKWAVPGNIDYGNTVTIKFLEFAKTPILDIMHNWVKMIRDYRYGVSSEALTGDSYSKKDYATVMYYWTTAPDARTIQYYACYDGMFPAKDPQDLFASDVETVGRLDIEIEFNVDYAWHEPWVLAKCNTFNTAYSKGTAAIQGYSSKV
jgi:hypothetical protein